MPPMRCEPKNDDRGRDETDRARGACQILPSRRGGRLQDRGEAMRPSLTPVCLTPDLQHAPQDERRNAPRVSRSPRTSSNKAWGADETPDRVSRVPIANAAAPIPASSVAPMPARPAPFSHPIDKARYTNLEQGRFSHFRTRSFQPGHKNHREHDYRRDGVHDIFGTRHRRAL